MHIGEIEDNIYELENAAYSYDNVLELASLYICKDNLLKLKYEENTQEFEDELQDILPAYSKYCEVKRKYQLNEAPDTAVLHELELVCQELYDLVSTIYKGTDMVKERKLLHNLMEKLYNKCCK